MSNHVPPSRKRYEARNPNISFRVPAELKGRVVELMRTNGISGADLVRRFLGEEAPLVGKAREEGYRKGYADARKEFGIVFPCAGCGKAMRPLGEAVRRAVVDSLVQQGWGHGECLGG